jgi:hypothetical protein
MIWS